ncbi:oxidoreductase [Hoyosella rhizosphaerae]|uniref:Oxidoreductase n=1 Tax=Hoyosella rhizosphaerae TaxID=1755582 RepID=A0A916UCL5_9ACTN|nr:oxidoreductase [Hoyosella rhizosphaerae]
MRRTIAVIAVTSALTAGCGAQRSTEPANAATTIADRLSVPWDIDFLPDGTPLVTERDTGNIKSLQNGSAATIGTIADIDNEGEGGLLGLAVSPTFNDDQYVYLYFTAAEDNRIVRAEHRDGQLVNLNPILKGIPRARIHNGGALIFGPDNFLYAATGDAAEPALAQDPNSLAGKILRITTDGKAAANNPTPGSPIFSLGHRNIQGLTFDSDNQLWASELGANAWDELNLITPGGNYGWPRVEGISDDDQFLNPIHVWRPTDASPAGIAILDDTLYMAALRGQRLWAVPLNGDAQPYALHTNHYGRLRAVTTTPQGELWVSTSNRDGRGNPATLDDRILRINPESGSGSGE